MNKNSRSRRFLVRPSSLISVSDSANIGSWRKARNSWAHGETDETEENTLSPEELEKIRCYLENPTKIGIWKLKARWLDFGGISNDVLNSVRGKFRKVAREDKIELLSDTVKMSFIFSLFKHIIERGKKTEKISDYLIARRMDYEDYLPLFKQIDLDLIKEKYSDAIEYFKENILFDGFLPYVRGEEISKIKEGTYILEENPIGTKTYDESILINGNSSSYFTEISLISIYNGTLEKLLRFYQKVEKITDPVLMPVYSPEEEVFGPYFYFLESTYKHIFEGDAIKRAFEKSISEYKDENYSYCINTIGVLAEDIFTQIYETLFRNPVPKSMALGPLYDLIHTEVRKLFRDEEETEPDPRPLYKEITELLKEKNGPALRKKTLKLVREILNLQEKDRKYVVRKIKEITTYKVEYSVFPQYLRENINELIRNRNATSHKSRIPIGEYEALRSVYCCVTLIIWWMNEKKAINWKKDAGEILKSSIERNSSAVTR